MSLSSPQTSSDVMVRAGPSSPVEGSGMTMKHGSLVNAFFSVSKKRQKINRPPRAFQEAIFYALYSPFTSWFAP
jgi:hypothetical protein